MILSRPKVLPRPITRSHLGRELNVSEVSGSRFPAGRHALDALEPFWNRFGDFYFSFKNMIFKNPENPLKIIDFH